jgi:hypothetical protein
MSRPDFLTSHGASARASCAARDACAVEHYRAPWRFADVGYAVACVAACVAIGVILAWGV